jgi:hypothetical protein
MADKAHQIASLVLTVFKDRSMTLMLQLYKSLIGCRVEYCCPLWNPSRIADVQSIENIQRQFTRRILGLNNVNYWNRLKELNLSSLQRRRERYAIFQTWKILHGVCPNNFRMDMAIKESARLGPKAPLPNMPKGASAAAKTCCDCSLAVKEECFGILYQKLLTPKDQ